MATTHDKIRTLLATKEAEVVALRTTLALLDGAATAKKVTRHASVVADALQLEIDRRVRTARRTPAKAKKTKRSKKKTAAHQRSAAFLKRFTTTTPTSKDDLRAAGVTLRGVVGPLILGGYLKKKGDGYVRTDKAYTNGATA